ncbi:sigma 54-interacting transcriptional regulator [Oxalobacteraceae bacterium A2-2]
MHTTDPDLTLTSYLAAPGQDGVRLLALTVLWHPEAARIGEQHVLADGAELALHRYAPPFAAPGGAALPLGHRGISREATVLRRGRDDSVTIAPPASRMLVELNGQACAGAVTLEAAQVSAGVVLGLGGVLLCLHWMDRLPQHHAVCAFLGAGAAAIKVRERIRQAAAVDVPVLLLGETGTGKEVAAQAIHAASARRGAPLVAVNMATLQESLAAADLFGAERGAYTGASATRRGLFAEAGNGVLFLDEIGATPAPVQPMLLRVLETGEYRPLGGAAVARSQARLIAATDRDLDDGGFSQPLLRRLEGYVLRLPPLRERREDIGLLVRHFVQAWEARSGAPAPELPVAFVSALCLYDWPGNVRQLASVVQRALIGLQGGELPSLAELAGIPARAVQVDEGDEEATPGAPRRQLADIDHGMVLQALEQHGWRIRAAALALGISRPSMYKLIAAHPEIRSVEKIPVAEIAATVALHDGDHERCASALKTPSEALRRHLRQDNQLRSARSGILED